MLAGISLGSNIGDRLGTIRQASLLLKGMGIQIVASSDIFETAPWGVKEQPWFLNACLLVDTSVSPRELLSRLQSIENRLGRVSRFRWGPREIDLDLLFMDGLAVDEEDLVLPHPEMHNRSFVLVPLNQVAPDWVHPLLHRRVRELLGQVSVEEVLRITDF
ncbi:MAG: 2-amino-4-hydroxy-6-hydroxymethyldihydropteridine diphosphokinase [Thermovirgaceae bacterium]|jgi:2-amino-4-hydroxy-6-hydroxymethyldihydropteridine diphosphokinase|nr:2-amino-4-hydroxy-6-hydroxymethyldihydropteridine diphosphokinase [Synergistales bacterium]MDI9392895.1 2-amino-4-hydroxy-6-hydroxymethyldihydropteridine diphosphokinase [Synergistota bacterium]MDY0178266.1 2-amino-4-hydroxy-6-hydroxymethyldihydropteridine diphosphokinase [Synergistaceae bacterium]HRW87308.1 2-amino-4-hydroxy-6-hydroxymethyldihydropteridine diphosphokinase [Thermovirgaceae bacterium]MDD3829930.1 2-amino-4-hydroxy-6-hydroxymethyldihydropteridine diphosphokinase [Synergistales